MKKIILTHLIFLLSSSIILCKNNDKIKLLKSKIMDANTTTDTKKLATDADALIANFFSNKKINLKDVPKEMHGELSFKRGQLIKK